MENVCSEQMLARCNLGCGVHYVTITDDGVEDVHIHGKQGMHKKFSFVGVMANDSGRRMLRCRIFNLCLVRKKYGWLKRTQSQGMFECFRHSSCYLIVPPVTVGLPQTPPPPRESLGRKRKLFN